MRAYLLVLVVAAAVTYLLTPVALRVALRIHAFAPVRARDVHTHPMARLGGTAMFAGVAVSFAVAGQMPFLHGVFAQNHAALAVLTAAFVVCVLGVADDLWDLDPLTKFAGQILAAGVMAWQGVQLVTLPIGGLTVGSSRMSLFLTVFAVVGTINAVNFIDGLDGLAAGVVAIGGMAFFVYTYLLARGSNPDDYASLATMIVAALIGACLGFLPHNFHPAAIFMGDCGSMLIGLMLAASAISVTGQVDPTVVSRSQIVPVFMPIILPVAVLLLPLTDLVLAVVRRVRAGTSPFSADRLHLHHRLLALGHSHEEAVLILYLWAAVLSFGTVSLAFVPWWVVAVVGSVALAGCLAATFWPVVRGRGRHRV